MRPFEWEVGAFHAQHISLPLYRLEKSKTLRGKVTLEVKLSQTSEEIDFAFLSQAPIGFSIPRVWLQISGYALLHSQSKCLLVTSLCVSWAYYLKQYLTK